MLAALGVLTGLMAGLIVAAVAHRAEQQSVDVGARAPAFHARLVGSTLMKSVGDYRHGVVLLNMWTTSCMPCREEMPSLERLHRAMGGQGLRVVAISLDPPDIDDDSIARFAKNLALTFEVVRDTSPAIWQTYQLTGVP